MHHWSGELILLSSRVIAPPPLYLVLVDVPLAPITLSVSTISLESKKLCNYSAIDSSVPFNGVK